MDAALDTVLAYHRLSKHRADRYAPGPEALDWDSQPAPFRRFADAPAVLLPLCTETEWPARGEASPLSIDSLGALFQLSLAITAWKSIGPDRWAVRANPSSGNLHPVEAYALIRGVDGLADGLWHYRPDDHSLELRAQVGASGGPPELALILTTVPWREAWKYGERAFRYCQLDVGHAQAALSHAASLLGWRLIQAQVQSGVLAHLCGVSRAADFSAGRATEREEAELLLTIGPDFDPQTWTDALAAARWSGPASTIDPHPLYRWPEIEAVSAATRGAIPPTPEVAADAPFPAEVLLRRRSAQRFDPKYELPQEAFLRILGATRPKHASELHLLLFVHRVEDLTPGAYLLPRSPDGACLASHLNGPPLPVLAVPGVGPLLQLVAADPKKLQVTARAVHCHQDLAATGAFSLGMVVPFAEPLGVNPANYRSLLREAGVVSQALYLAAEREGLAGCGIGCFFDDNVHRLLNLADESFQSLYHFAVGRPVPDPRIETQPPYPPRAQPRA